MLRDTASPDSSCDNGYQLYRLVDELARKANENDSIEDIPSMHALLELDNNVDNLDRTRNAGHLSDLVLN